jgi:hypothetical protein
MSASKKSKKKTFTLFSLFRDKKGKGSTGLSQTFFQLNLNPDLYQYTTKTK